MAPSRVLLTGANGFLGLHIVSQLVKAGYSVRCVVRSQEKGDLILQDFPDYAPLIDIAVVPDITISGAFDAVVQSSPPFTSVIHQASPFLFSAIKSNSEFLDPAIKGTTSLLHSIKSFAHSVSRVIYTSSCAAIVDRSVPDVQVPQKTYSEADWNPMSYDEALNGDKGAAYRAGKKFAELAAWDFIKNETPNFDLVSLNPPMIFGPFLPQTAERLKIKDLNESNARVYNGYINTTKTTHLPHNALNVYIDVRDLAAAHLKAIEIPEAGGERIIVSAREIPAQNICDLFRGAFPELGERTPVGKPGTNDIAEGSYLVDNSKLVRILELDFRSDEECFLELARQLLDIEKAS